MEVDRAAKARAERARRRAEEERRLQEDYERWCRIIMGDGRHTREDNEEHKR